MGSNSFRLEIGAIDGKRYRRIDYLKETVRLGAGLDAAGVLGEEAATRGLECLARFATRLADFPAERMRAVATQTLREAKNRDAFLRRAERALGHEIEVISGREEARLIYAGVARLQPSTTPRLVIDIGGRSTEMILGNGPVPERAESFAVGSVSLSMRYFPEGRFSEKAFRAAQVAAGAELEEALLPFSPAHWQEALGASGTVGAVAQVLAASTISDGRITLKGLRWLSERCLAAGSADRLDLPGLKDDRRAVIGGGLAILQTLATQFGIEELKPARGALRQGVIFDLAARRESEASPLTGAAASVAERLDLRDASVAELQRRFDVDIVQAERVAALAGALLEEARPGATSEARRELRWAALLHEVGMTISHHDHHRHSAYILAHVDAAGFSQSQLRRVGDLVLGQRGGLRKIEARLAEKGFALDLLCLRVAVVACHARADVASGAVRIASGNGVPPAIVLAAESAEAYPQLLHLLGEELDAWAKSGVLAPSLRV
ncbi:MAG: Ppx/GppA family phosphatase [Pseudomonadota bacterium]|nr:Ppx/GppA family phosphatase [Pseudomonadota bacterium]